MKMVTLRHWSFGFSLIELFIVLSIISVLLCYGMPSLSSWVKKNQLELIADDIKEAIHMAHLQTLATNDRLMLAPLPDSKAWSTGMVLFVDNGMHHYTAHAKVLQEWRWYDKQIGLSWHGFQSNEGLLFTPDLSSRAVNGYFMIKNDKQQIKLTVNRLGRVKDSRAA